MDTTVVSSRAVAGGEALVDRLAAAIHARVLAGDIPTGSRLRQETLASEFGVSRTPVREALRKLQADGLIELEPNRGAVVRGPSGREVREAYEVRAELEGLAAALAAARIRDHEVRRLHDAQGMFGRAVEGLLAWKRRRRDGEAPPTEVHDEWMRGNDVFHLAIHEAAGNERLQSTLSDLHGSFPRDLSWIVLGESSRLLEENVAQHGSILDAIEGHDAPLARQLMKEHVLRAGELVVRRFEQRPA
jgi:DNA-binding GntR family transcriptional regulator